MSVFLDGYLYCEVSYSKNQPNLMILKDHIAIISKVVLRFKMLLKSLA